MNVHQHTTTNTQIQFTTPLAIHSKPLQKSLTFLTILYVHVCPKHPTQTILITIQSPNIPPSSMIFSHISSPITTLSMYHIPYISQCTTFPIYHNVTHCLYVTMYHIPPSHGQNFVYVFMCILQSYRTVNVETYRYTEYICLSVCPPLCVCVSI
jgi:hypothetical protein